MFCYGALTFCYTRLLGSDVVVCKLVWGADAASADIADITTGTY